MFNGLSALVKVAGSIKTKVLSSSGANNAYDWGGAWNRDAAVNMYAGRQKNPPASALITSNYASIKFPPALLTGSWPAGALVVAVVIVGGGEGSAVSSPRSSKTA